jgi:hypothetical protein
MLCRIWVTLCNKKFALHQKDPSSPWLMQGNDGGTYLAPGVAGRPYATDIAIAPFSSRLI